MRSKLIGWITACLLVALLPRDGSCDFSITTDPSPPRPGEPFDVTVSGSMGRYKFLEPKVEARNGIIEVSLGRACGLFTCDPPKDQSFTLRSDALPPGNYVIIAYESFAPDSISGVLPVTIGSSSRGVYRGLYWASPANSDPGWGVSVEHQGDTLFVVWFTYDPFASNRTDGGSEAMWLVMPNAVKTGGATYSGDIYRTTGVSIRGCCGTFMKSSIVGSATVSFGDNDNAVFTYSIDGVMGTGASAWTESRLITRQVFSAPVPACAPGK